MALPNHQEDGELPRTLKAVLQALDDKTLDRLRDFVASPFAKVQRRVVELFLLVLDHFFSSKTPTSSWQQVLKSAGYQPLHLPKLFTLLQQAIDQFLALDWIDQESYLLAAPTIEAYIARGVETNTIQKRLRQWRKRLEADRQSLAQGQQNLLLLHLDSRLQLLQGTKVEGSYFTELHHRLDMEYLMAKLKYCLASINEAQLLKLPQPDALLQQVLSLRAAIGAELPPFGRAYAAVLDLMCDPLQPIETFEFTIQTLLGCEDQIGREDCGDLFHYVLNLCYRRIDSSTPGFTSLAVKIYDHLIALDLLTTEGVLPPRTFWNIVSLNCREQRWEWCKKYIAEHQKSLPPEDQSLLPILCLGLVDFHQGHQARAAVAFKQVVAMGADDHFLALESRSLLLKAYFHIYPTINQDQHDELYRQVSAFQMYVRRHARLDAYHQRCYLNFIKYFQQMLRHVDNHGPEAPFPKKLVLAVEDEKTITNKAWLLTALKKKS